MKLYSNPYSTNAKRARVVIAELGLHADVQDVDFAAGQHRSAEYMKLNPNGKVPTFIDDDGTTLWESRAILVYLSEKHDRLRPTDPKGRAEQLRWMFWNACHYGAAVGGLMMEKMVKPMLMQMEPDAATVDREQANLDRFAPILDAHLDRKDWILGNDFSICDIDLGVTTEAGARVGLDLAKYPHIKSWLGRLTERPSWKA